jgi:hypothetical protein
MANLADKYNELRKRDCQRASSAEGDVREVKGARRFTGREEGGLAEDEEKTRTWL